jgi:hypothetical protein
MKRTLLSWGLILCLAPAGCGFAGFTNRFTAEEEITRSFPTRGTPRVVVDTFNGAIDTVTGDDQAVEIKVTKRTSGSSQEDAEADLDNIEVALTQDGNTVHVTARSRDQQFMRSRGAAVDLHVPPGTILELRTSNGKVTSTGPMGDITAHSTNGAVRATGGKGKLDLNTNNGPIAVDGGTGRLELHTSNGAIEVASPRAVVNAETSNGAIHFRGQLADGAHTLQTSNGKISVELPSAARFRIDASTSNGSVRNDFALSHTEDSGKTHLRGEIGESPTASLTLHTSNGSIEIRQGK